jgi:nucleotide-binding universal stress UspA family protein
MATQPLQEAGSVYSTIVVGTDGSATATKAVERAAALAGTCGAKLHLVQGCGSAAVTSADLVAVAMPDMSQAVEAVRNLLEITAEELRGRGFEVEAHVVTSSGPEAVLGVVDDIEADLVVVGSQGMSGKRRFLLGSVPNAVSHHAPCDVLIIRTD